MTIISETPTASASRPLAMRMRSDLVIVPQRIAGRRYWAVKDPMALAYFQLRDEELAVLEMLDGQASAAEIVARFERRFAPRRLTPECLQAFIVRLHRDGLVISDAPRQGEQLLERAAKDRRRRRAMSVASLLAIRLPGVRPAPLLDRLYPLARLLLSPLLVSLCLALITAAVALVATHSAQFEARLPDMPAYFTARNAVLVLLAISLVKVLHELGHALVCRHFGGDCHEVGPMFLVFAPCLYCDVSDSWMFSSRFRRAAVAAAGIYVEALLAALATFIWWFSEPGLTSALALNVMVVCSVSTLLFNGNPLLRYDGYYVLSDLIEIPNLAEQSSTALRGLLSRVLLGLHSVPDPDTTSWRRLFLVIYGAASIVYRLVLVAVLLWFCYRVLAPYRLEILAALLAVSVVGGLLAGPFTRGLRFARTPTSQTRVSRGRMALVVVLGLVLALAAAAWPLPVRVTAPVLIEPHDARRVYVTEPGTLEFAASVGQIVHAGQTLATLSNPDLDLEIVKLIAERNRQQLRLENLSRRRGQDRSAAAEIPTAREALADLEERLSRRRADHERLTLIAPVGGTVLPPEWKDSPQITGTLASWQGTPLLTRNQGALLETGTLFCLIGDPHQVEAVAVVDQSDVERIAVGQRAEVKLDQAAGAVLWGTITEIAEIDVDIAPRQLASGKDLPTRKDSAGMARPLSASYQVRIELDATDRPLLLGAPGRVRIHAPAESLLGRINRWLRGTFHFPT
jgi:putative peptide zinc metalloprotease protein